MRLRGAPIVVLGLAAGALGAAQAMTGISTHTADAPRMSPAAAPGNAVAREESNHALVAPDRVPLGMRAVAVPVAGGHTSSAVFAIGGRVDVVVAFDDDGDAANGVVPMARTVVSNAEVLGYPRRALAADAAESRDWVVLAVRPGEAERLALGAAHGRILLALRGPIDTLPADASPVTLPGLLQVPAPAVASSRPRQTVMMQTVVAPVQTETPAAAYQVEAIRATRRTDEAVR